MWREPPGINMRNKTNATPPEKRAWKGKAGFDGKGGRPRARAKGGFQGNCPHCRLPGHKKSQCRKLGEVMRKRRGGANALDESDYEDEENEDEDETGAWGTRIGEPGEMALLIEPGRG